MANGKSLKDVVTYIYRKTASLAFIVTLRVAWPNRVGIYNRVQKDKSSVDFDQRYSAYPTPTYPSDSVSAAKNSKDINGKTKSARNFIYALIR